MPGRSLAYLPERRRKTFVLYTSHTFALALFAFFIERENKKREKPVNVVFVSSDDRLTDEATGLQNLLTDAYALRLGLVRDQHWSALRSEGLIFTLPFSLIREAENVQAIVKSLPVSVLAISLVQGELEELGRIADVWREAGRDELLIIRVPQGTTPGNIQHQIGRNAVLLSVEEMLRTRQYGKRQIYGSLSVASFAAQRIGFASARDYRTRAQLLDPSLPVRPDRYFCDEWVDCAWDLFLGIGYAPADYYESYEEARSAARELGAMNRREYAKAVRDRRNLRLHPNPSFFYRDKGWDSWNDYLGTQNISFGSRGTSDEHA